MSNFFKYFLSTVIFLVNFIFPSITQKTLSKELILNEINKNTPLILQQTNEIFNNQMIDMKHSLHYSHYSHYSHSSHYSHYSHYSSW